MQFVSEVVVEVPDHVHEAQRDPMHHQPGAPPTRTSGVTRHLVHGEQVLVPGVSGRQELHGVEMAAGAQNLGHMGAEVLQNSGPETQINELISF